MRRDGTIEVLNTFCDANRCLTGNSPYAGLVLDTDGSFYGTRAGNSIANDGSVFKTNVKGQLTTLHRFHSIEGNDPEAALLLASDGNFYGTTDLGFGFGGNSNYCRYGCGTVFKITSKGELTTLHTFDLVDGGDGGQSTYPPYL